MNYGFWQDKLTAMFGEEFTKEFEALLDKHDLNDVDFVDKVYVMMDTKCDEEDLKEWLENETIYPTLAYNDKFMHYFLMMYRKLYDNEYGKEDNILGVFNWIRDEREEWADVISAAVEDEE